MVFVTFLPHSGLEGSRKPQRVSSTVLYDRHGWVCLPLSTSGSLVRTGMLPRPAIPASDLCLTARLKRAVRVARVRNLLLPCGAAGAEALENPGLEPLRSGVSGLGSLGGSSRTGLPQTPSCGLGGRNTCPRNDMPLSIRPLKPDHRG